jgi:hypothetical protein
MPATIAVTECDHDAFLEEEAVALAAGVTLKIHQSRTRAELVENCLGAEGILVQYAQIDADVMDALPRLRAIGRYGVGVDSVDIDVATARDRGVQRPRLRHRGTHQCDNVTAVAPGYMATEMNSALIADPVRSKQIGDRIPAGRWGEPADVGGAVVFLASSAAAYVHGHVLAVAHERRRMEGKNCGDPEGLPPG